MLSDLCVGSDQGSAEPEADCGVQMGGRSPNRTRRQSLISGKLGHADDKIADPLEIGSEISSDDDGEFEALTADATDPVKYGILRNYFLRYKHQEKEIREMRQFCDVLERDQKELLESAQMCQRQLDRSNMQVRLPTIDEFIKLASGPADVSSNASQNLHAEDGISAVECSSVCEGSVTPENSMNRVVTACESPFSPSPFSFFDSVSPPRVSRETASSTVPVHGTLGEPGELHREHVVPHPPVESKGQPGHFKRPVVGVDPKIEVIASEIDEFDDFSHTLAALVPFERPKYVVSGLNGAGIEPLYRCGVPSVQGVVTPLFEQGMLFKIVTPNGAWAFYNDTDKYEMKVMFVFGAASSIVPGTQARVKHAKKSEQEVHLSVFPGETEYLFVRGSVNGFRNYSSAVPLPPTFINNSVLKINGKSRRELQEIANVAEQQIEELTDEVALCMCLEARLPFVDPTFPPGSRSLFRPGVDDSPTCPLPWRRPAEYIKYLVGVPENEPQHHQTTSAHRRRTRRGSSMHSLSSMHSVSSSNLSLAGGNDGGQTHGRHSSMSLSKTAAIVRPAAIDGTDCRLFRGRVLPEDVGYDDDTNLNLISALAALAEFPMLVRRLFRHPYSIEEGKAERGCHAYRVTINYNGWWTNYLVDDYVPASLCGPLSMLCPSDLQKLWVPLAEKAYAKAHGSYSAISAGDVMDALQDLTGFPSYDLGKAWEEASACAETAEGLFRTISESAQIGDLVLLSTPIEPATQDSVADARATAATQNGSFSESNTLEGSCFGPPVSFYEQTGLHLGMSYSVLRVVDDDSSGIRLVKIRNPWFSSPWTKGWSMDDPRWEKYPTLRRLCGVDDTSYADGVWISWEDALRYFDGGVVSYIPRRLNTRRGSRLDGFGYADYRVRGTFSRGIPSMSLCISVSAPVTAYIILSQSFSPVAEGGLDYVEDGTSTGMITPLMLCVAQHSGPPIHSYTVDLCSANNPNEPRQKFGYVTGRDVAMRYTFTPNSASSSSSYYVVPRAYDCAVESKPYVIGVLLERGSVESISVQFKSLPSSCKLFTNSRKFSILRSTNVPCDYQVLHESGRVRTHNGTQIVHGDEESMAMDTFIQ